MKRLFILSLPLLAITACAPTTDADRALIGAGLGATIAHVDGRDGRDVILSGVGGAAAGLICDDVGVCQGRGPYYR